jgi:hypothetical protein
MREVRLLNNVIGLRHDQFKGEPVQAINSIDAVFADDVDVREIWSQLIGLLYDSHAKNPAGRAIREAKRREMFLVMVISLGLRESISTTDLMRVYQPQFLIDEVSLRLMERTVRRKEPEAKALAMGIDLSPFDVSPAAPITFPAQSQANGAGTGTRQ